MKNTAARKLKLVPEGYLIVGVDPHKKKHAAVVITQDFTARDKSIRLLGVERGQHLPTN